MKKVVINRKYGGFGLSDKAINELKALNSPILSCFLPEKILYVDPSNDSFRSHPDLVSVVGKLGKEANGCSANLKVVEIPDDINYEIEDYDGMEHISEIHREWR